MMLPLSLLAPLLLIAATAVPRASIRKAAAILSPVAVLPAAVLTLSTPTAELEVPWLLFGTVLRMDAVARPLLLIAVVLYGAALVAVTWRRGPEPTLTAFLLATYLGTIGAYLAADTVAFYLSFAVLSFSAAGLVIHHRTPQAHRATVIYLVMTVLSETALLGGLLLTVDAGGALLIDAPSAIADSGRSALISALLLVGFGVKAGLVPLHLWLPLAHPAAPPAASAVLSGVMVKVGIVGWLRFLPPGSGEDLARLLLVLALAGAFLAVVVGLMQDDPKVILAYSTISQLGFISAVLAAGLLVPGISAATTAAVVLYAVHHGLAKGALFLGVPVARRHGRGPTGVLVLVGMAGAGLALAGAPWTSGAFAKHDAKYAVAELPVLAGLLPLVATGSTLLLLRLARVLWRGERTAEKADGLFGAWLLLCLLGTGLPWWIGTGWLGLEQPGGDAVTLWDSTWPILLALVLAAPLTWLLGRVPAIPPGDIVVPLEAASGLLRRYGGAGLDRIHTATGRVARAWGQGWSRSTGLIRDSVVLVETRARLWTPTGMAVLVLLAVLLLVLLFSGGWSP